MTACALHFDSRPGGGSRSDGAAEHARLHPIIQPAVLPIHLQQERARRSRKSANPFSVPRICSRTLVGCFVLRLEGGRTKQRHQQPLHACGGLLLSLSVSADVRSADNSPHRIRRYPAHFKTNPYPTAPRALIFKAEAPKVQSVEDLEQLMRWNDPAVSATAPASAICMRGDIGPSPSTGGCLDSKVSSDALAEELKANAVSGPTEFINLPS